MQCRHLKMAALHFLKKKSMSINIRKVVPKDELENIYTLRNKYKEGREAILTAGELINYVRQNKL